MGGPDEAQSVTSSSFWAAFLATLYLAVSWITAPAAIVLSLILVGFNAGMPYCLAVPLLYAGLIQASTVLVRAPICIILLSMSMRSSSAFCGALIATVMSALLSVPVAPWPKILDIISVAQCYYAKCEMLGHLESIKPEKSVLAFHPHGILAIGFGVNGAFNPKFCRHAGTIKVLVDRILRYSNPLFKIMVEWYTQPNHSSWDSADRSTIIKLMQTGVNLSIIPGGFMEATLFCYGTDRVAIKKKKGLIKLCLQHGYHIHPIYTFGESDSFHAFQGLRKLRLWLARYNIPTVIFFGNPWCPFLPRTQTKIMTFVGKPLEIPHIENPSDEDVEKWHGQYVEALISLFNEKKAEAGKPDATLEVF